MIIQLNRIFTVHQIQSQGPKQDKIIWMQPAKRGKSQVVITEIYVLGSIKFLTWHINQISFENKPPTESNSIYLQPPKLLEAIKYSSTSILPSICRAQKEKKIVFMILVNRKK